MNVKKITPVLFVEDVELCVKFWVERLGFEKTNECLTATSWLSPCCKKATWN